MNAYYLNEPYQDLLKIADEYNKNYRTASPFPNIYFDNFFNPDMLEEVLAEFPDLSQGQTIKFNNPNEVKLASRGEIRFQNKTKHFVHFLNSEPFLQFLQILTNIEEILLPDLYFEGGGFHEIKKGGLLKIHVDFNKHKMSNLDRRLNVLVYLNKQWKENYGRHCELWDREMKQSVKKKLPVYNCMAIFLTTDYSYHGHPDPLTCPINRSRKSLALDYYSNGRPQNEITGGHQTLFVTRKGIKSEKQMNNFKYCY